MSTKKSILFGVIFLYSFNFLWLVSSFNLDKPKSAKTNGTTDDLLNSTESNSNSTTDDENLDDRFNFNLNVAGAQGVGE